MSDDYGVFKSLIPPVFREAEISDFSKGIQDRARLIVDGGSALILGDNGLGKTRLAWAVAKEMNAKGKRVKYVEAQRLLFDIKRQDDPYGYIDRMVERNDCIIIDEIDKIFESKADFVYLNSLVNQMYQWMKQVVILGNGKKDEFIASLGQSIYSRLRGNKGMDIVLTGKDRRLN